VKGESLKPRITVTNRQRKIRFDAGRVAGIATRALPGSMANPGPHPRTLPDLRLVEVSLISDTRIAQIHLQFMAIRGPTDVITFPYGEILIGAGTAARQAHENGQSIDIEIARYIIHGLLHLNGHHDADPLERGAMHRIQEAILSAVGRDLC